MHRELCNLAGLPQGLGDFEATRVSGFMAKAVTWGTLTVATRVRRCFATRAAMLLVECGST